MKKNSITIQSLYKNFNDTTVINNINVLFTAPHSYALTGKSGSGKSTLLHIIAGLDGPTSGTITYNELPIYTLSNTARAHLINNFIGIVFQKPYLIKELSILENIMLPGLIAGRSLNECIEHAHRLLNVIKLEHKIMLNPMALSGGEQQRIALARALFNKPAFLLADEPTGNLDYHTGNEIVYLIRSYQQQWGMGIIINTHDRHIASQMDHQYILENGTIQQFPHTPFTTNGLLINHV